MKIIIVGAGLTGLSAGFSLAQKGHRVTIFEKEKTPGGLSASFQAKNWDWPLENFFHHLFVSDLTAQKLINQLGLASQLFFTRPKTALFYQHQSNQFDSPLSVLAFPHLNLLEKVRAGTVTASLKLLPETKTLANQTAAFWLDRFYGQKAYRTLWEPLLKGKFGQKAEQVAMIWFWARIKKRSARLGYLKGGFKTLVDALVAQIRKKGGQVFLNHEVKNLQTTLNQELRNVKDLKNRSFCSEKTSKILVTIPTLNFLKMAPELPLGYRKRLKKMTMLGAVSLVLTLKDQFLTDGTYWLNINEKGFPFVAVVEHTNFVDKKHYGNNHLVYTGGYYPQNHRYFQMSADQIFAEWQPFLKKINPQLKTKSYQLNTNLFAQPLVTPGYQKTMPSFQTPLPNVFLANMQMVYPFDRGINYAIELGQKVAKIMDNG